MSDTQQFCTFHLDAFFFGVSVERVQEVLRYQEMTPVPMAPAVVEGLINLRGQIVPAINLRRRMGFQARPEGESPMNVVVHHDEDAVSLLVDRIGDVFDIDQGLFEAPPETLAGEARDVILGAYKLPDKLLLVLDIDRVLRAL